LPFKTFKATETVSVKGFEMIFASRINALKGLISTVNSVGIAH
jgi:hypothetical protein